MRIGITMRTINNETYPEKRNVLSEDWEKFIHRVSSKVILVPLLNSPKFVVRVAKDLELDGVIFSGGEDWGSNPERDETEEKLFRYCLKSDLPVLGVCRGMQVFNVLMGGKIEKNIIDVIHEKHVKVRHKIIIVSQLSHRLVNKAELVVNSYHNHGVIKDGLAKQLKVFALSKKGAIEGLFLPAKPLIGIQWHPEREGSDFQFDKKLFKALFKLL